MALKLRCNDTVIVVSGKNKGKIGKIKRIFPSGRMTIRGINVVTRHEKSVFTLKKKGKAVKKEATIHISNVAILNRNANKADKIRFRRKNKKKFRVFKSDGKTV